MAVKSRQRGISIVTLIFILAILAAVGSIVLKALPSALEYQAVLKAVNRVKNEGTPALVRSAFDRAASIDDIKSITGKDLTIAKEGEETVVSFSYTKEFHMFGPAWLLMKYDGRSRPGR
ncbi:MAG: DUF4845 domain-containing protein [Comamonadaceae bacterium]|nr:MAG: DUF4845 domain-containing protein [Comamonadaceae bacterium]